MIKQSIKQGIKASIKQRLGSEGKILRNVLTFDGVNQYVDLDTDWVPTSALWSIEVQGKVEGITANNQFTVADSANPRLVIFFDISTDSVRVRLIDSSGTSRFFGLPPNSSPIGQDFSVRLTVHPDRAVIDDLITGEAAASVGDFSDLTFHNVGYFAQDNTLGRPFNGTIYDVKITDHAGIQNRNVTNGNPGNQIYGQFNPIVLAGAFEVSFDIKSTASTGFPTLLSSPNAQEGLLCFLETTSGKVNLRTRTGGVSQNIQPNAVVADGAVHNIKISFDGVDEYKITVDDTTTASSNRTGVNNSFSLLYAKNEGVLSQYLDGAIANLRIVDNGTVVMDARMDEEGDVFENRAGVDGPELWDLGEQILPVGQQTAGISTDIGALYKVSGVPSGVLAAGLGAGWQVVTDEPMLCTATSVVFRNFTGSDPEVFTPSVRTSPNILLQNKTPADNEFIANNSRHYPMNEGSGTIVNDTRGDGTTNGTIINGATWSEEEL